MKLLCEDLLRRQTQLTLFQVGRRGRFVHHVTAVVADEALAGPALSAMAEVGVAKPKYKAPPARRDAGSAMA
jgi:hypothetical protein